MRTACNLYKADSLPVAKHYATSLHRSPRVLTVRVVDQTTERVVSGSSDLSGWPFVVGD